MSRTLALLAWEIWHRGYSLRTAIWHLDSELGLLLASAALAAIGASVIACALVRHENTSSSTALRVVATVLVGFLFAAAFAGWPIGSERYLPDLRNNDGRTFAALVGIAALASAVVFIITALRVLRSRDGGRMFAVVCGAALLALPITVHVVTRVAPPERYISHVVREVLFEPPSWTVIRQHPEFPPQVAVLTPGLDYRFDAGDKPALVMPPPCEVSFEVRANEGGVELDIAAGIDESFVTARPTDSTEYCVEFVVERNGESVFDTQLRVTPSNDAEPLTWSHPASPALTFKAGDKITLRTNLLTPTDASSNLRIPAGFGGLTLKRVIEQSLGSASPRRPNVVLILIDTLRADRLSCYDAQAPGTPQLDQLAARGTLFERAYSTASWTWPSTASILTGLWPESHGVVSDEACYLNGSIETLPEIMAARGLITGAFSCNPLITPDKNFDQGFGSLETWPTLRKTDVVLPAIDAWLENNGEWRFFLYLHLVDPHSPHEPTDEARAKVGGEPPADWPGPNALAIFNNALLSGEAFAADGTQHIETVISPEQQAWMQRSYDAAVLSADEYIGQFIEQLRRRDLLDNTLIVVTSDHGEELLQHGLVTHGHSVYEELMRVPLIFAGPGVPAGKRVTTRVSNRHIAPTLAARAGGRFGQLDDALDLLDFANLQEQALFFSTEHGVWNGHTPVAIHAIQVGNWVLHYAPNGRPWSTPNDAPAGAGEVRLFDLEHDALELHDVAAREPQRVERMRALLLAHLKTAAESSPTVKLGAGGETLKMLRAIGYIGDER